MGHAFWDSDEYGTFVPHHFFNFSIKLFSCAQELATPGNLHVIDLTFAIELYKAEPMASQKSLAINEMK